MKDIIRQDRDRLRLFKKYGYDIPKARSFILKKARLAKGSILEIGTGRGHMATALAKKGFRLVSVDLDRKAQKVAGMHLRELKRAGLATLRIMNAEKLRYKDHSFDYVVSVNFMHHAQDPLKCLKEMIRVTRNKLIIADVNKRGQSILERVHKLDGHSHEESKISFREMEAMLRKSEMDVKKYKDTCQTVLIATKGAAK